MTTHPATAVVFPAAHQVTVETLTISDPGPGQVLLESACSLISTGTECTCLSGDFEEGTVWHRWVKYPFRPGYAVAARVAQVGEGVTTLNPGDRVVSLGHHQAFGIAWPNTLFPIPDNITDEQATWAVLAYIAQHGFRKANLRLGETAVVIGLGPVGQLMAQYARNAGAARVIAIDTSSDRLTLATGKGASHALALPAGEAIDTVRDLTAGRMAEVVFDMTGAAPVLPAAMRLAARFGRVVLVGDSPHPSRQRLTHEVIGRDLTLIGAHGPNAPADGIDQAPWSHARMVELFFNLLAAGRMSVDDMISHRFPITDAPAAYDLLMTRRHEAMGVLFTY